MKIYFLSSQPCALSLNGTFYGTTDSFERFAEINLSDRIFVKFSPEGAHPIGFFLTEEILTTPPNGCEVYIIKDGLALRAYDFAPIDCTLYPITQQRFGETVVSVFKQGRVQIAIQSPEGFFTSSLPPSFSVCTLSKHCDLYFVEGKNHLAVYTNEGKCVFMEEIISFSVTENTLNAYLPLSNTLGRVADCTWHLDKTGCQRIQFSLRQTYAHDGDTDEVKIRDELLAYTFFERVLLGENYVELLAEDLQPKAEHIVSFLGNYLAVSLTADPYTCGLIQEKSPRLYEVNYFTVRIIEGKIADVIG
jgi:hypothetical protein